MVLDGGFCMKRLTWVLSAICLLALAGPASAGIVFDNYPINGTIDAWTINFGYWVSDSFTIASPALVTGVNFGSWNFPGDDISAVDWAIGTGPNDSTFGSGSGAAVSDTLQTSLSPNPDGANIYSNSISFAGVLLGPGTYYLTLQNAVIASGDPVFWYENDGAGVDAWEKLDGELSGNCPGPPGSGTCAESFQIVSNVGTPEPGSLMLFGSGTLLLAGALRRKARR